MTSDADTPDFPALAELASRLEGKDRKTCELALYTLKKQDERLAKKDAMISDWEFRHGNLSRHVDVLIDTLEIQSVRIAELEAYPK